jgi:hypothetical protein
VNCFSYESRFAAATGAVAWNGRSGAGIVCVIASDASAGAGSSTDLEVYAFDANTGGPLVALTSDVTAGPANAVNQLSLSANGNVLVGQRAATAAMSRDSRIGLQDDTDLFVVTNVHASVYDGAAPDAFVASRGSHGTAVALLGERAEVGPLALAYSFTPSGLGNFGWQERTLRIRTRHGAAAPRTLDPTPSHYAVLAAGRRVDDDPESAQ